MNRFLFLLSFCFLWSAYGLNAQEKTERVMNSKFLPVSIAASENANKVELSAKLEPVMTSLFTCADNSLFGNTISSYNGGYVSDTANSSAGMTSFSVDGTIDTVTIWGMNLYYNGSSYLGGGGPVVENPSFNVRFYYPNPDSPDDFAIEYKGLASIASNTETEFSSRYENSFIYQYKIALPEAVDFTEGNISVIRASEPDTCLFLWVNSKTGSGESYTLSLDDQTMSVNRYPLSLCLQGTVPDYPRPQDLTVSSITQHSAVFNWTEEGSSSEWQLGLVNNEGAITSLGFTDTESETISDLEAGESYTVLVRSVYATDSSLWSPLSFTTVEPTVDTLSEGFESGEVPPANWEAFHTGSGSYDWYASGVSFTGSYSAVAMFESTGEINNQWLVSGRVKVPAAKDLVFFTRDNYADEYGSTLSVRVSTDSIRTNMDAYTDLAVVTESEVSNTGFVPIKVDVSDYIGQEVYFAFIMSDDYGDAWAIDDIGLITAYTPYSLEVLDNQSTTATIGWLGADSDYKVQYGPTGFTLGEGTILTVTNADSVILSGLTPASYYDVYVQAVNENGISGWSDSLTFFTTSAFTPVKNYPLTEDFSGDWNTMDWRVIDADEDGYTWMQRTSQYDALAGDNMAQIYHAEEDYLVSPPLVVKKALQVSWFDRISNASTPFFPQIMNLKVSTEGVAVNDFSTVKVRVESYQDAWIKHTVYLGDYVGDTIYLAFNATIKAGDFYGIDSVVVEEITTCPQPYALDATNVTVDAACLSWVGNATNYTVEYGESGFDLGEGSSETTTEAVLTLSELNADTRYEFYVKADSSNGVESAYAGPYLFITLPETVTIRDFPYYQDFEDMDSLENWIPMLNYPDKGEGNEGTGLKRAFGAYKTWRIKNYNESTYSQRLVYEGSQSIFIDGNSMFNDWLVSPDIEVPSLGGSFDFMYFSVMRANDTLRYYVNVYDGEQWNNVLSYQDMNDTVWYDTPVSIDLTPYASKTVKVAFVHSTEDGYQFAVDSLVIHGEKNTEDDFLSLSFEGVEASYTVDAEAHTIAADITSASDITKLVASFTLSSGATAYINSEEQESGVTVNDFSSSLVYTVVSEDESTQSDWTVSVTGGTVGLSSNSSFGNLQLYPNPTSNLVTIEGSIANSTLKIYNLGGQCLQSLRVESDEITLDLSALEAGIYFCEISNAAGSIQHKIVKE